MLGLILVQTVCKGYQQTTKVAASKERVNPFLQNGISHPYQLDQSISILRVFGCYFSFLFKS